MDQWIVIKFFNRCTVLFNPVFYTPSAFDPFLFLLFLKSKAHSRESHDLLPIERYLIDGFQLPKIHLFLKELFQEIPFDRVDNESDRKQDWHNIVGDIILTNLLIPVKTINHLK